MTCSAVFFFSLFFFKYPKINAGNDKRLSRLVLEFSFVLANKTNSKSGEGVSQIIVWMIRWKVWRKDWHLSGKRPQIGLCRKISNLYKVSSVFNVCFISFTKKVNYKVSSIYSETLWNFVIAEQSDWSRKISLTITRQITQENINLLLTKTTAARSSQEAVKSSHCSWMNISLK